MDPGDLTSEEATLLQAIADLEAAGEPTSLEPVADRAGLPAGKARIVLSRLLGDLGLVQEVQGDDLGPYFVLSGRAGAAPGEEGDQPLDDARLAGELERYLGDQAFPATTETVVSVSTDRGAPQPLLQALRRLPPDATYLTLEDVAEAVRRQL